MDTLVEELIQDKPHLMAQGQDCMGVGEDAYLHFYIDPKDVNFINRILEGYEYISFL